MTPAELRALEAAATPGPWEADDDRNWKEWAVLAPAPDGRLFFCRQADAALICAARNELPALLDRLEHYERALRAVVSVEPIATVYAGGECAMCNSIGAGFNHPHLISCPWLAAKNALEQKP